MGGVVVVVKVIFLFFSASLSLVGKHGSLHMGMAATVDARAALPAAASVYSIFVTSARAVQTGKRACTDS